MGAGGCFFGFGGFLVAFIGRPAAIVTLVRRIMAELSLRIAISPVAANGFLTLMPITPISRHCRVMTTSIPGNPDTGKSLAHSWWRVWLSPPRVPT